MEIKTDNDLMHLHELCRTVINMENAAGTNVPPAEVLLMKSFIIEQMHENDVDVKKMRSLCDVETVGNKYISDSKLYGLGILFEHYLSNIPTLPTPLLGHLAAFLFDEIYINGVDVKKMKEILADAMKRKTIEMAAKN